MRKKLLIALSLLILICLTIFLFYSNNRISTLRCKLNNYAVEFKLEECNNCMLDWPVEYTVTITTENKKSSIAFSTETPSLLVAVNSAQDKILLLGTTTPTILYSNNTGFEQTESSSIFYNKDSILNSKFSDFKPYLQITNQKSIKLLDSSLNIQSVLQTFN